jgi:hypothetical protein
LILKNGVLNSLRDLSQKIDFVALPVLCKSGLSYIRFVPK